MLSEISLFSLQQEFCHPRVIKHEGIQFHPNLPPEENTPPPKYVKGWIGKVEMSFNHEFTHVADVHIMFLS